MSKQTIKLTEILPDQKLRDYQESLYGPIDWETATLKEKNKIVVSKTLVG